MIYFVSDQHFGHNNIIKFCKRPFKDIQEMNYKLIQNHNSVVQPEDEVYFLGDFGFMPANELKSTLEQLNGRKYLIRGNHDKGINQVKDQFEWIKDYHEFWIQDKDTECNKRFVVLFHYPILSWHKKHYGSIMLHGHCHGDLIHDVPNLIDVGVDCFDYTPVSYEQIKRIIKNVKEK